MFKVTVDGNTVIDGGRAFLGIMPSGAKIVAVVGDALMRSTTTGGVQ